MCMLRHLCPIPLNGSSSGNDTPVELEQTFFPPPWINRKHNLVKNDIKMMKDQGSVLQLDFCQLNEEEKDKNITMNSFSIFKAVPVFKR